MSTDTVYNSIKEIESQSEEIRFGKAQGLHGGRPYYVLDEAQVTAVKRHIIANLSRGVNNANKPTTTVVVGEDPALELASLYARIDEIKSARIAALEKENAEKAERLAIAEPKAEYHDRLVGVERNH